jgi:rhodanese-related sulfurtransferase
MAIERVSAHEFIVALRSPENTDIIDVRSEEEFISAHLPGATLLPLDTLTDSTCQTLNEQDQDRPLYVLCGSGKRAHMACERISQQGSRPLIIVEGGIGAVKAHDPESINSREPD